jgi:hypothetical protein
MRPEKLANVARDLKASKGKHSERCGNKINRS